MASPDNFDPAATNSADIDIRATDKPTTDAPQTRANEYQILALYNFVSPKIPQDELKPLQQEIETECRAAHARGCILVASEGINGTICYPTSSASLFNYFQLKFPGLRFRISHYNKPVFTRLKVKLKPEIVTLSCDIDPTKQVGTHVPPREWNALLKDPECLVIDTRNDYEVRVGTFMNAVNPHTHNFKEFPEWMMKQQASSGKPFKSIAMFCTGGIRCEKATSLAIATQAFPSEIPIYHLEGGILAYLDEVPRKESLYIGECYVFDKRISVSHGLIPTTQFTQCHACRSPILWEDTERDDFKEGVSCRYCIDSITDKQRRRLEERQRQMELSEKLGTPHLYDPKEVQSTK
jgi:UPF0176 protein